MAWSTSQGPAFDREHGSTEAEWLRQLPGAVGPRPLRLGAGQAWVSLDAGELHLQWQPLPPRQISLVRVPRLAVRYRFTGVPDPVRAQFLRYFDLFMQRGGG